MVHLIQTIKLGRDEKIAIVGQSGGGKSTFLKSLCGLSFESNFTLCTHCNSKSQTFSFMPQRIHLYPGTIRENIILDNLIDHDFLNEVLRISLLDNVVSSKSLGIETVLDPDSPILSGGEIQRLGFARTLYRRANIMLLDEPTSSLDSELERRLFGHLLNWPSNAIVVTHNRELANNFSAVYEICNGLLSKIK